MEPPTKVPVLRLCSLHLSPSEMLGPSQLIENYLGVQLNANYRYLSVGLSDAVCFIWSRRPRGTEDVLLQNIAQIKIFKKIIRLLRDDRPLSSLSDVSNEKYRLDIRYESPPENAVIKKLECRAELITAIFHERIIEKQSPLMRCYRDVLATVLEWHMKEFFKDESLLQLKATTSCPTLMEELGDPLIKLSPSGRMIRRSSQSNVHRLMPSFEKTDGNAFDPRLLVKELSMDCLDYCRSYWLGISDLKLEYVKLIDLKLLEKPQIGLLVEEMVARDITIELVGERLALDIARNVLQVSMIHSRTELTLEKSENHALRFQKLLKYLMTGLMIKHNKKEEILDKWNWQAKREKADTNNDQFVYAVMQFFKEDLSQKGGEENKLFQLLILLRQRMYIVPMTVIRAALKEIDLKFENQHPAHEMSYHFLENSSFKYQVSRIASFTQEEKKMQDLPSFQLEMKNVMSASLKNLNIWSSNITIELSLLSNKKKLSASKDLLEQKVCEPLQKLGFTVKMI